MTPPIPPTVKTSPRGYVKILAPPFEPCPKCGSLNTDKSGSVWRVAYADGDARGECDCCAYSWKLT